MKPDIGIAGRDLSPGVSRSGRADHGLCRSTRLLQRGIRVEILAPIPILRSFDERKAREFYLDFLGFSVDWEHRFADGTPLYMQISLGRCHLHLSEHHGDSTPGSAVRVQVTGIDEYCRNLNAIPYPYYNPSVEVMPWGTRDMKIIDPFGNRLIFSEE